MAAWQIRVEVSGGSAEAGHVFADLLEAALDAEAVSLHREDGDGDDWLISILTAERPADEQINTALDEAARLVGGVASNLHIQPLAEQDWLAENRKSFPPLEIGPFWVYGTHIADPVPEGKIGLCLDAGQAFGSGSHATTAGCMQLIENHLPRTGRIRIADIGCGSGILAMGAAKWNPDAFIIAADNDQRAVDTTVENAARNGVDASITCGLSDGYSATLVIDHAPYDMILANILPGPLIDMAADAAGVLAETGILIVSGLLEDQQQRVIAAHEQVGLECIDSVLTSGWAALALRHRKGA